MMTTLKHGVDATEVVFVRPGTQVVLRGFRERRGETPEAFTAATPPLEVGYWFGNGEPFVRLYEGTRVEVVAIEGAAEVQGTGRRDLYDMTVFRHMGRTFRAGLRRA